VDIEWKQFVEEGKSTLKTSHGKPVGKGVAHEMRPKPEEGVQTRGQSSDKKQKIQIGPISKEGLWMKLAWLKQRSQ
jgi:hypothetical protein